MKKILLCITFVSIMLSGIIGCVSSEHRAEEFCAKGMSLLDKDLRKAEKAFKDALVMKSNMVEAMYGLALVRERQGGTLKDIFKYLDLAIEQNPSYMEALVKSCQLLSKDKKLDLALIRCNKALELDQSNVAVLNLRADIQLKLNDPVGAIDFAERSILIDSSNQDAFLLLAKERLLAKDEMKAIEYLKGAVSENEKNLTILLLSATVLENISLEDVSKIQQAELAYKIAIDAFPESVFARKRYINFLLNYGRNSDAEAQLRKVADSMKPGEIQAKLDVVEFVTSTKGAEAGQAELESLVSAEPDNHGLAFVLLSLYKAKNESSKEDALLNKILTKAGKTADGYRARGLIAEKLIRLGQISAAEKILNEVLDEDNRNALALILKADIALGSKDYAGAIADLRSVLNDSPKSSSVALKLASAYESSNLMVLAEEHYLSAYNNSKYSSTYGEPYAKFLTRIKQSERADKILKEMHRSIENAVDSTKNNLSSPIYAALLSNKNDIDGSLSAYKRANETDSDGSESILAIINTYIQSEKYIEALNFINNTLINQPENMDLMLAKAEIYEITEDYPKAIQVLIDVIEADNSNSAAYQRLGLIYLSLSKNEDAQAIVSKGLSFLPDDFELKLIKVGVFEASERKEDAIKLYEKLLEERPDSIMASNGLIRLLLELQGDGASFMRAYSLAGSIKKNHAPQFLETYARICYKVGNLTGAEEALSLLKISVNRYPNNTSFKYHLAKVYLTNNDRVNAKKVLEEILSDSKSQQFEHKEELAQLLKAL